MKKIFFTLLSLVMVAFAVQNVQAQCTLTAPADLTVATDPGVCIATIPAGVLLAVASADCAGVAPFLTEGFDGGVLPAGWAIDDGTTAGGGAFTGVSSDGATVGNGIFFNQTQAPGGAPPAGFSGNVAMFDDCFADNLGVVCLVSPVLANAEELSLSWQNEAFAGSGDLTIDIWDGAAWNTILTVIDDSDSAEDEAATTTPVITGDPDIFDISAFANPAGQARFCYDDQGFGFGWGAAFDNIVFSAVDPNLPPIVSNDSPLADAAMADAAGSYPPGVYVITYETSGPAGPVSATTTLTVEDQEAPVFTSCPSDITLNLDPGACEQIYSYDVIATENCASMPLSFNQNNAWPPANGPGVICSNAQNDEVQYSRIFAAASPDADFTITSLDLSYTAIGSDVDVTVWTYNGAGASFANLTQVINFQHTPAAVGFENVPVPAGAIIPAGSQYAITIGANSGPAGGTIFGMDPPGETDPTYVSGCAVSIPGLFPDLTNLDGFFIRGINMQVNGEVGFDEWPVVADPNNLFASGSAFPIGGPYTITYTATDDAGNTSTCTFDVTVEEYPTPTGSLVCNQAGVQVSLDDSCEAIIGADDILEGGPYGCYDNYTVNLFFDANMFQPVPTSPVVTSANLGQTLYAAVIDPAGNSCWGLVTVKDKQIPDLQCASYEVPCADDNAPGNTFGGTATVEESPMLATQDNATVTYDFDVAGLQSAPSDVNVSLDIAHTWVGDLVVTLTSPGGTSVELLNNIGGPGFGCAGNDLDLVFDDEAADGYDVLDGTCDNLPAAAGTFQPLQALSAFDGQNANGTWTLSVQDLAGGDGGSVNGLTVEFNLPVLGTIEFPTGNATRIQTGEREWRVIGFDGCSDVTLTYYDLIDDVDCLADPGNPFTKIITRVWSATDAAGNSTTCQDTLSLIRATIADIELPSNFDDQDEPSLACEDREPATTNFCGQVLGWNAIDAGEYSGDDYVGHPSPSDALYNCGSVKWFGTGVPGGIDCGNINYSFADIRINSCATGASDGCYKLVRNWTILDWCTGELATHAQIIKVADKEGPTINDLDDVTISTDVWACEATYYVPAPWIMDNCSDITGDYTVVSSNGTVDFIPALGRYVITGMTPYATHQVTVRAEDCCGNATNHVYNVTVADLVPPTAVCEVNYTTSLNIDGTAKVFASTFDDGSHDACNPVYFKTIRMDDLRGTQHGSNVNQNDIDCDDLNGDDNQFRFGNQIYFDDYVRFCCEDIGRDDLTVVFRVFDVNPGDGPVNPGRMGPGGDLEGHWNDCMVLVNVDDKLPPVIEAPTNITVSCDYWFDMENLDDAADETFGKVVTARYADQNAAVRDSIIIYDRWCDGDANNPFGMGSSQYDPFNPTQTYRKAVGIDGLAYDNCDVSININVVDNLVCGQGTITRIFTATDPGGRTDSDIQRITIVDCDPFYINDTNCFNFDPFDGVRWPCDFNSTTCGIGTDPSTTGEPQIFNDDNCALISVTYVDEDFPVVPDACFKIKRIWRVTDWCQFDQNDSDNNNQADPTDDGFVEGRWEYVQYIKVLNSDAPDVTDLDYDNCSYNTDCTGDPVMSVTIDDDCTPEDLLIIDFKLDANNDGQYDVIGSNVFPYPYPNPNGLPVLPVNYTDNGDGTYTASVAFTGIPLEIEHRILWSAEDVCSNVGTLNEAFTINDCKLPTPKLLNGLVIENMPSSCEIDVPAMMFDAGSFDNCGVQQLLIVSESQGPGQTAPPASASAVHTFDRFDIGNNTVDIWVQDVNGNWAYATTFLVLQDNAQACTDPGATASVSGNLASEAGQAAANIDVQLMGSAGMETETVSSEDGDYTMIAATNENYSVIPEKLDEVREGISTLDLVLISRHLIGLQPLDSPYKLIAADVNNDESINTFDMVDLQKVILFIYDEFPNNKSFRFFDAEYTVGANPWASDLSAAEKVDINGLSVNETADFVAVKTGDVNGSAQMNANGPSSNRSYTGEFFFNVADQALVAGETYTVDFTANEFTNLFGYQFTLGFDQAAVEIADVATGELEGLSTENFGTALLGKGVMTANYGNVNATSLENGTTVFSLTLTAKTNAQLSDVLNIDRTRYTRAEAYQENLDHLNVNIQFTEGNNVTVATTSFELLQNQPNPFKDVTEISFVLPQAAAATLTIYDVSGKILKVIEGDYAKGYNKETVSTSDLGATGVLYYQLDTDEFSATKKMIVIE